MNNNELDQIEKLLKRVVDSRDGYADANEKAEQSRHQEFLGKLAEKRQDYALFLQRKLEEHGRKINMEGSFLADVHRFFMDIKWKLDSDDEELFEEIIRGEKALLDEYDETLAKITSDDVYKGKLQKQRDDIASNLELVKIKEEAA
jgi:uncharacterized protein (TIGR02284 family)